MLLLVLKKGLIKIKIYYDSIAKGLFNAVMKKFNVFEINSNVKLDIAFIRSEIEEKTGKDVFVYDFEDFGEVENLVSRLQTQDLLIVGLPSTIRAVEKEYYLDSLQLELEKLARLTKYYNNKLYIVNENQEFFSSADRLSSKNPNYLKEKYISHINVIHDGINPKPKVECF